MESSSKLGQNDSSLESSSLCPLENASLCQQHILLFLPFSLLSDSFLKIFYLAKRSELFYLWCSKNRQAKANQTIQRAGKTHGKGVIEKHTRLCFATPLQSRTTAVFHDSPAMTLVGGSRSSTSGSSPFASRRWTGLRNRWGSMRR